MTPFSSFYLPIRAIVGDRKVHGVWNYSPEDLDMAVKTVFALGKGPDGYALDTGDITSAAGVTPDVMLGTSVVPGPYAIIFVEASLVLIGGEDGAVHLRTREISMADSGHRKRDLLLILRRQVDDLRNGPASSFQSMQSLAGFAGSMDDNQPFPFARFIDFTLYSPVRSLSV